MTSGAFVLVDPQLHLSIELEAGLIEDPADLDCAHVDFRGGGPDGFHRTVPEDRIRRAVECGVAATRIAKADSSPRCCSNAPPRAASGNGSRVVVSLQVGGQIDGTQIRPIAIGIVLRQLADKIVSEHRSSALHIDREHLLRFESLEPQLAKINRH